MADPISWLIIGSTVLGAGGTLIESEAQANDAEDEARISTANAQAVAQQAGQAEDAKRKGNRELLARQRAAFSENGIVNDSGTAVEVQSQSEIAAELDALNIRYEGMLQRTNYLNQASAARARSSNTRMGGYLAAAGQVLGGAAGLKARAPSSGVKFDNIAVTSKRMPTPSLARRGPY